MRAWFDRADLDAAVARHPAGRLRLVDPGYGLRMVTLREAERLPVLAVAIDPAVPMSAQTLVRPAGGFVDVPAVNVLECQTCEALFRVGSAGAVVHYRQHRAAGHARAWLRSPVRMARRAVRRRVSRLRRAVAGLIGWE